MSKIWMMCLALLYMHHFVICERACDMVDLSHWHGPQKQYPHETKGLSADPLPKGFNWGNVNGKNYLTRIQNQKIPSYCGSCWAMAGVSTISDRISIMRGGAFPEISLSTQVLLACDRSNKGCNGGDHVTVLEWIKNNYVTDESCAPYMAKDYKQGLVCDEMAFCKECNEKGDCWVPPKYNKYTVEDYGNIRSGDVEGIMREIHTNGPMICSVNHKPINEFKGDGIFSSDDKGGITHAVELVGWGESDAGVPYWIMKNTFGEEWGDRGFIKIFRGNNTIHIEEACTWVKVKNTWEDQIYPHHEFKAQKAVQKRMLGLIGGKGFDGSLSKDSSPLVSSSTESSEFPLKTLAEQVINNHMDKELGQEQTPVNFFLGDIKGENYLSYVVNQHLPVYCESGWAQAVASALSDRINYKITKNLPRITLSVQPLLNCKAGGTCTRGSFVEALKYIHDKGIGESGCQNYDANDPMDPGCYPIQQCMNCQWIGDHVTNCFDINYRKWYVSEMGKLKKEEIKKELVTRGPIVCRMQVTQAFKEYKGGVYSEHIDKVEYNHDVSIVGYGKQSSGGEYWIVRNTWGTQFGENGFFRIRMGQDNLGIEEECWFGVPTDQKTW